MLVGLAVDRLERRIRKLGRLAGRLHQLTIDVASELTVVRQALRADASGRLNAIVELAASRAAHAKQIEWLRASDVGARTLEMRMSRSGSAMVRIDEGKWFRLSRVDARLLNILSTAVPRQADGFPAWQTYEQIAEQVRRKTGIRPTRRSLIESVYRLRLALDAADLNRFLVRVDRKRGRLRFLLRSQE